MKKRGGIAPTDVRVQPLAAFVGFKRLRVVGLKSRGFSETAHDTATTAALFKPLRVSTQHGLSSLLLLSLARLLKRGTTAFCCLVSQASPA